MTLGGDSSATTLTDSSGNYSFSGLVSGAYTVTPSKTGVTFSPATRNVTASNSDDDGSNFTASVPLKPSGPLVIKGQNGTVIQGLKITSTTGDCLTISNSSNVTVLNSEIGPCAGNAIKINGGVGIGIYDNYIHPETQSPGCCDNNDGIFATGAPHNLSIQGNVIAYGESNIEIQGGTQVSVIGNFLLNPRGPSPRGNNFQCWNNCSNVTVQNNYALSSTDTSRFKYAEATEDSISFGVSTEFVIRQNLIQGGHSQYGCGIMADTYTNAGQVLQNELLDTGQCGIGLTDGSHIATGNWVYNRTPVAGGGNSAMYVSHYGKSATCGPMTITNNVADALQTSGQHSGWWNGKNCGAIPIESDMFGKTADSQLSTANAFVPPMIPPQPKNCVALSPYSTQTNVAACVP